MILAITTMVLSIFALYFSPKHLSKIEIYSSTFFALYIQVLTDMYLDLKLDLFGYFTKGANWRTLPFMIIVYSSVSFLFLNFFPFRKCITKQIIYVLGWSIFATVYEILAVHTNLFYYHAWKWWYSAIIYPFLFLILVMNLKLIRKFIGQFKMRG